MPANKWWQGWAWMMQHVIWAQYVFIFFIYSFTIDILYISVHWANAGQRRSMIAFIMQANEDQQKPTVASTGWQPPTAIVFTHHHLIPPITPLLCSTTTTLSNHTTSSFNHKLQSFSFDIGSIILSLSSNQKGKTQPILYIACTFNRFMLYIHICCWNNYT